MSRDLIDLAMSSSDGPLDAQGVAKAERAYGRSIADAFSKAKTALLERPRRLRRCMQALKMDLPEKSLRRRVERLALPWQGSCPPPIIRR